MTARMPCSGAEEEVSSRWGELLTVRTEGGRAWAPRLLEPGASEQAGTDNETKTIAVKGAGASGRRRRPSSTAQLPPAERQSRR